MKRLFGFIKSYLDKEYSNRYYYAYKANSIVSDIINIDEKQNKMQLRNGIYKSEFKYIHDNIPYVIEIYHFDNEKKFKNYKKEFGLFYYDGQYYFSLYELNGDYFSSKQEKLIREYLYSINENEIHVNNDVIKTINSDISKIKNIENGPSWEDINGLKTVELLKCEYDLNREFDLYCKNIVKKLINGLIPLWEGDDFDWMNRKNFKLENSYPIDLA